MAFERAQAAVRQRSAMLFVAVAVAVAAAVGAAAVLGPLVAIAVAIGAVAVPAALLRPKLIIYVVVATVFTEFLTVGGITLGRLVAPLAFIAVIAETAYSPVRLPRTGILPALVLGYVFLAVASILWSNSIHGTFQQLGSLGIAVVYMSAFAVLVRSPADLRRLFVVIATCALALGVFWILSYLQGVGRAATAGDPNFFAGDQVVALAATVVLATSARTSAGRVMLYLILAVIAGSVVASLSRSGALALVTAIGLMMILPASMLFRTRARKVTFFVAALLGLALILPIAGPKLENRFQEGIAGAGDRRRDLWLAALTAYEQNPVVGIGYGAFKPTMTDWLNNTSGVHIGDFTPSSLQTGQPVHNAYLESLTELGPAGMILFIGIIVATARSLYRSARLAGRAGSWFLRSASGALLVGLLAFAVAAVFLPAETSRTLWMFVGLSLAISGMMVRTQAEALQRGASNRSPSRMENGR